MDSAAVVLLAPDVGRRDSDLCRYFIDHRAGAAGALVVHRRKLLPPAAAVVLEQDDLRILTAELDHGLRVGMPPLDSQRNRVDLLHETGSDCGSELAGGRAGGEHTAACRRDNSFALEGVQPREEIFA